MTTSTIVVLADDDLLVRLVLAEFLREDDRFTVLEVSNAEQALVVIEATHNVACLVTDVNMGTTMDGYALARLVDKTWPSVAIVIISGRPHHPDISVPPGAILLQKPIAHEVLVAAVETSLSAKQPLDGQVPGVPLHIEGLPPMTPAATGLGATGGIAQPLSEPDE